MKMLDSSLIFDENIAEWAKTQQNVQNIGDTT